MVLKIMKYVCVILLAFLFVTCKKEKQVATVSNACDTIFPSSYLPVYPGSKWFYLDDKGDTLIQSTDSDYKLNEYIGYPFHSFKDPAVKLVYVPYWNGTPVFGYSSPLDYTSPAFGPHGLKQIAYLTEHVGDSWEVYHDQYGTLYRLVTVVDTTLTVNSINYDHVIAVYDYSKAMSTGYTVKFTKVNYYAKNIGLIKRDNFGYKSDGLGGYIKDTQHLNIINYFINH